MGGAHTHHQRPPQPSTKPFLPFLRRWLFMKADLKGDGFGRSEPKSTCISGYGLRSNGVEPVQQNGTGDHDERVPFVAKEEK